MDDHQRYQRYQRLVEGWLEGALPLPDSPWPAQGIPGKLVEAMRYSVLGGGKRLRPVLLLAAYESCGGQPEDALPFAGAVELIHTYSLVHDDLPAMDDDDLRRGRPTSHKVFGEAMAILAGDALLTLAFEWMADSPLPGARRALAEIARRAGPAGMIAGQVGDMLATGRDAEPDMVRYIHTRKTADLITAAILAGLLLGGAKQPALDAAASYGLQLGLAFQMTDDLLDLTGDPDQLGKNVHRDGQLGKLTWPRAVGVSQARQDVLVAVEQAAALADVFQQNARFFKSLALSIPKRVK